MQIIEAKSYEDMSRKAAGIIAAQIILKPQSVIGLATGSTPIGAYNRLAELNNQGDLDFSQIRTVNLDEYCGLDGSHEQSYRYFMDKQLFSKINIPKANTHIPNGTAGDMKIECARYDTLIEDMGGIDLQLLGIGHNGHIGFNEPNDVFTGATNVVKLKQSTINANARFFESENDVPSQAITMGIKSIMLARRILLVVSGRDKQKILKQALYGPITPEIPTSILQLHVNLTVVTCD